MWFSVLAFSIISGIKRWFSKTKNTSAIIKWNIMGNEKRLDQEYWDTQYKTNATGWDWAKISPAIQAFTKTLENKNTRITITWLWQFLWSRAFAERRIYQHYGNWHSSNINRKPSKKIPEQSQYPNYFGRFLRTSSRLWIDNWTDFFCALPPPTMREQYVRKIHELLSDKGKISRIIVQ